MTLQQDYQETIAQELKKELKLENDHTIPKITKVVVSMGLGEALTDKKVIDTMSEQLGFITGQKPAVTRAKKAIATFKLRAGVPIGIKTTLRGKRMYSFLERFIKIVLPRVRDFRGINPKSFDGQGNLSIGFSEAIIFPEMNFEKLDKIRGIEITIVTTARTDEEAKLLLSKMKMPFLKGNN